MIEEKTPESDSQSNDSSANKAPSTAAVPSDAPMIEAAPAELTAAESEALESALKASAAAEVPPSEAPAPAAEPPAGPRAPAAEAAPAPAPEAEAAPTPAPAAEAAPAPAPAAEAAPTPAPEARLAAAAAPDTGASGGDDVEEVEPESVVDAPKPTLVSHKPPPPPSLRFKSAVMDKAGAGDSQAPGPRFKVTGTPKLARDLMTRQIFTIDPEDTLEHLEEHMHAFRFRHLPVVDGKKVVGLITHRDLLHASSSFLSERAKERDQIIHKLPAKRIMRRELITVRPTKPLSEVAAMMWESKIGCVLVTEDDGTLLGILTEADFIRLSHYFLVQSEKASS